MRRLDLGDGVEMRFILIPPGEFILGSPEKEKDRYPEEGPAHKVKITKPFYLAIHETTQEQYEKLMGSNPSKFKGKDRPVESLVWDAADQFCKKLSGKAKVKARLPTEAEWEYACRAGTTTRFSFGDDLNYEELTKYAWFWDSKNKDNEQHPVGLKLPNPWGLYDMHGNVWEWCQDWGSDNYFSVTSFRCCWCARLSVETDHLNLSGRCGRDF